MNAPVPPQSELACYVGPPLRITFAALLGANPTSAEIEQAVAHYRDRFHAIGLYENVLYDGVPGMLATLQNAGLRLFVATAKPHPSARRVLEHFGLSRYFENVYGSEFDGTFDDKADLLAHLLVQESLAPHDALMIGDRSHDMIAAGRNGITGVGVTYGYGTADELNAAGASVLCATPEDITAHALRTAAVRAPQNSPADAAWPFADPPNLAVITTQQVTKERQPILYVFHDADDGSWQFHAGGIPQMTEAQVVSLAFILKIDPSLRELADLPVGWSAERGGMGQPWRRKPSSAA